MFWQRKKPKPAGQSRAAFVAAITGNDTAKEAAPAKTVNYDLLKSNKLTRTDMHCTECHKFFIASLDMAVDGNHVIECPYCRHEHCRVVEGGRVTEDRWSSRHQRVNVPSKQVWKSEKQPIITSTASAFIRDRWLNFGDDE